MTLSYQSPGAAPEDEGYLKALSICYYVFAGLAGVGGLCMTGYLGLFALLFNNGPVTTRPAVPPPEFKLFFTLLILTYAVVIWGFAACLFLAGRRLVQRRGYVFILVMAGITCLSVPLGTVLGVFTIVVLQRPSVRVLFGRP